MKRTFILLAALFCVTFSMNAKHVTIAKARKVALCLMAEKKPNIDLSIKSISPLSDKFESSIYIINFAPEGWMMLSSDDTSRPLLAYSKEGFFKSDAILPDNMLYWLSTYSKQIKNNTKLQLSSLREWDTEYYVHAKKSRSIGGIIDPLIRVNFNQSEPFNVYCPKEGGKSTLVGCVAVAMGQAMSVLKYPARPKGKHVDQDPQGVTFPPMDFDAEKPYDWNKILNGSKDNYDEVARFLYHMGVAVDMMYGVEASGAFTYEVPAALIKHFSLPDDLKFEQRDKYQGDWKQLIINELGAGRPIIYSGVDKEKKSGHAFNLDGYDGEGSFHVNWGWGGVGNAFYSLDALRDDVMGMDYMDEQGAVIGLRAPSDFPQNILLTNNTAPSGKRPGEIVGKISVSNQIQNHEYQYIVRGKYNKINKDYAEVPFKVNGDTLFTTASLSSSDKLKEIEILATDVTLNASIQQGFVINITGNSEAIKDIDEATTMTYNKLSGMLVLTSREGVFYSIVSDQGEKILEGKFSSAAVNWSTKDYNSGVYTITLSDSYDSKSFTVSINSKK